jgi:hypothetical protein
MLAKGFDRQESHLVDTQSIYCIIFVVYAYQCTGYERYYYQFKNFTLSVCQYTSRRTETQEIANNTAFVS